MWNIRYWQGMYLFQVRLSSMAVWRMQVVYEIDSLLFVFKSNFCSLFGEILDRARYGFGSRNRIASIEQTSILSHGRFSGFLTRSEKNRSHHGTFSKGNRAADPRTKRSLRGGGDRIGTHRFWFFAMIFFFSKDIVFMSWPGKDRLI